MHTEDSYRYTGIKDTYSTLGCTMRLAQGCITRLKGVTVNSVEALMTALTKQLLSVVIEANSVSIQLHPGSEMRSSGAARNWTMEFSQSVLTRATARIIGQKRRSQILLVCRADADGSSGEGCDQFVGDEGEDTLWMHGGIELETAFAKDKTLPDPSSTTNQEFKRVS